MVSDEKLMESYQKGDYMAFEALYLRHKDRVYSYLNKRVHNKDVIGDLFQEIFFKLHRSSHTYNPEKPFLNWLYTICKTQMLDFIKKKKINEIELKDFMLEHQESEQDQIDLSKYQSLNEREKKVIELRFNQDNDYDEIASKLSITVSNGRKIISRAISKIKDELLERGTHG